MRIFIFCAFFSLSCVNAESSASDPGVMSAPFERQNIRDFSQEEIREALKEGQEKMGAWLGDRSAETVLAEEGPRLRARYAGASERERLVIGAMFSTLTQKLQESFPDPKAASSEGLLSPSKGNRLFLESSPGAANLDLLLLEGAALDTSAQIFLDLLYVHGYRHREGDWLLPPHDPRIRDLWQLLADEGMSRGLLNMGNAYLHGQGVEPNIEKGLEYLERSHLEEGWMALAMHYYLRQDLIQARAWWRYAALETDNAEAWYNLGVGAMEMRQYGEALEALQNALKADPEYHAAKIELSRLYTEGWGVEPDLDRAEALLREVLNLGREQLQLHMYADYNLGRIARLRGQMPLAETRERFESLRRRAASQDPEAMRDFGEMLWLGFEGFAPRPKAAEHWLLQAAEAGDVPAMRLLGVLWLFGGGDEVPPDPPSALGWLRRAADGGDAEALFRMGSLSFEGKHVPQDPEAGERLYRAAAGKGDAMAMWYLGMRLMEGRDMAKIPEEGEQWLRKAAETGNPTAILVWVSFMMQPELTQRHQMEIVVWSTLAIRAGRTDVQTLRDQMAGKLSEEEWQLARRQVEERFQAFFGDKR